MTDQSSLSALLDKYYPVSKEEITYKVRFEALLQEPYCFERRNLKRHFTSSCWVTNSDLDKVLLLHHAKLDKWLQPGGHADGETELIEVAKKELEEETNLKEFINSPLQLFDIDIHQIPIHKNIPSHEHFDTRFHFIVREDLSLEINSESKAIQWVPIDEVEQLTNGEQSIMRMVHKTKAIDL